jgi:hypothetical protein
VSTSRGETYGYTELAARIEAVLGQRPSVSTLRAERAEARRRGPRRGRRPGLTDGMPAPLPAPTRTSPAQFDAAEVERWLVDHPLRGWNRAVEVAREGLTAGEDTKTVVAAALRQNLSWSVIAQLLSERDGQGWSKAWVHTKFRDLAP